MLQVSHEILPPPQNPGPDSNTLPSTPQCPALPLLCHRETILLKASKARQPSCTPAISSNSAAWPWPKHQPLVRCSALSKPNPPCRFDHPPPPHIPPHPQPPSP